MLCVHGCRTVERMKCVVDVFLYFFISDNKNKCTIHKVACLEVFEKLRQGGGGYTQERINR